MNMEMEEVETDNFQLFQDCLATPLIEKSAEKPRKQGRKARGGRKKASMSTLPYIVNVSQVLRQLRPFLTEKLTVKSIVAPKEDTNDAEELGDFIDVCQLHL